MYSTPDRTADFGRVPAKDLLSLLGRMLVQGGLIGSGFVGGAGLPGIVTRLLSGAGLGALDAKLAGQDPLSGAVGQAGLSAIGDIAAPALAKGGIKLGMTLGNVRDPEGKAAEAFYRQWQREGGGNPLALVSPEGKPRLAAGVSLGDVAGAKVRRKALGERIGKAAKSIKAEAPFSKVAEAPFEAEAVAAARNSSLQPRTAENAINSFKQDFIDQHVLTKNNIRPPAGINPKLFRKVINRNLPSTTISASELGAKAATAAEEAGDLMRNKAGFMSAPDRSAYPTIKARADLSGLLKQERNTLGDAAGIDFRPMDAEYGDLSTIGTVNNAIRGGGGVVTDLGQMGMRGGLGANTLGVGLREAAAPSALVKLAGPLSIGLLSPKVLSRLGYTGGTTAKATPTLMRIGQLLDDISQSEPASDLTNTIGAAFRKRRPGE